MVRLGICFAVTVVCATSAAPAQAAALRILTDTYTHVDYVAEGSEANHVRMSWDAATNTLSVRDDGVPLTLTEEAQTRCSGTFDRVQCVLSGDLLKFVQISLGDGDDSLTPGLGRDEVWGGAGRDTVSYQDLAPDASPVLLRATVAPGVRVSLDDVADDGLPFEADNVRSDVEDIFGSGLGDVLIGNAGSNLIYGGHSDDRIEGAGGDDSLHGGYGNDTSVGGPGADAMVDRYASYDGGDDTFIADDGEADFIDCGFNTADAVFADVLDTFEPRSCESITIR